MEVVDEVQRHVVHEQYEVIMEVQHVTQTEHGNVYE